MRGILEAKYKNDDINKVMKEQCKHLTPRKLENNLKLKNINICSMKILAY